MAPEPRRVDVNRVPIDLFIRPCSSDLRAFDIVDQAGTVMAREVPDLNTARVLAAGPKLLDSFYEMTWVLNAWFEHGFPGVGQSEAREGRELKIEEWLLDLKDVERAACALDGRFPL